MDWRTAETGDDGRTSEEAAAGHCLQLDLEDSGTYIFPVSIMVIYLEKSSASLFILWAFVQPQLPAAAGALKVEVGR